MPFSDLRLEDFLPPDMPEFIATPKVGDMKGCRIEFYEGLVIASGLITDVYQPNNRLKMYIEPDNPRFAKDWRDESCFIRYLHDLKYCKSGSECKHRGGPLQPATPRYFYNNRRLANGLTSKCKACVQHYNDSRPKPQWWLDCLEYWGNRCVVCGLPSESARLSMDHWIPRSKGGLDRASNIIPLCCQNLPGSGIRAIPCNVSKSNHSGPEWLIERLGEEAGRAKLAEIETYFEWVRQRA